MNDGQVRQVRRPVLCHEASVALLGGPFGTEQARGGVVVENALSDGECRSVCQERTEVGDIVAPVVVLAVGVQDLGAWGEVGDMLVGDAEPFREEEGQVITLRIAKQVRCVAETHVDQGIHAGTA